MSILPALVVYLYQYLTSVNIWPMAVLHINQCFIWCLSKAGRVFSPGARLSVLGFCWNTFSASQLLKECPTGNLELFPVCVYSTFQHVTQQPLGFLQSNHSIVLHPSFSVLNSSKFLYYWRNIVSSAVVWNAEYMSFSKLRMCFLMVRFNQAVCICPLILLEWRRGALFESIP